MADAALQQGPRLPLFMQPEECYLGSQPGALEIVYTGDAELGWSLCTKVPIKAGTPITAYPAHMGLISLAEPTVDNAGLAVAALDPNVPDSALNAATESEAARKLYFRYSMRLETPLSTPYGKVLSLIAMPPGDDDRATIPLARAGHMANDGAGPSFLRDFPRGKRPRIKALEAAVHTYYKQVTETCNTKPVFHDQGHAGISLVAVRDIAAGEHITIAYNWTFWATEHFDYEGAPFDSPEWNNMFFSEAGGPQRAQRLRAWLRETGADTFFGY